MTAARVLHVVAALALVSLGSACRPGTTAGPREPRSLLLLTLDTTRADHLTPYGADPGDTPALAHLARRGAVFTHAYAVAPITLPAHASLLTGLYPPRHGVRDNGIHALPETGVTLAERFAERGFRTAAFISAAVLERRYGLDQGFAVYDDRLAGGSSLGPRMMIERRAGMTVEAALDWLADLPPGERFFLWVHLFDPHVPYAPPEPWDARYADEPYRGEVAYMDDAVKRLLADPRIAAEERVAVVAVGDHGEALGEHGEMTHGLLVYDATLRIPWIARIPGIDPGLRIEAPVSQVDLFPTLVELFDLELGAESDGRSLLPLLAGEETRARDLYAESLTPFYGYGWSQLTSLRRDGWKLIRGSGLKLYHLPSDPDEETDLAAERGARAGELAGRLETFFAAAGGPGEAPVPADPAPADAGASERLRSLGYLGGEGSRAPADRRPDPHEMVDIHNQLQALAMLRHAGRFEAAREGLRGVLEQDPGNPAAAAELAFVLSKLGEVDEAVRLLQASVRDAPEDADLKLRLAGLEARRGAWETALELVEAALELNPRSLEARLERARFLARLGREEEARAILDRLAAEGESGPWIDLRHAQLVDRPLGRLETAERRLRRAVETDPYLAEAWTELGEVLEAAGRPREAVAAYRDGLRYHPGNAHLLAALGLALAELDDPAAGEQLGRAITAAHGFRGDLHSALAGWLERRGRADEAARALETLAGTNGAESHAVNARAQALAELGRLAEAERIWRRLAERAPDFPPVHSNLAALALHRGAWSEAESHARRAIELAPETASAWNHLAIALEEQGRPAEAEAAYRRAVEADPANWQLSYNLALLLEEAGEYREAGELLARVARLAPDHAGTRWELGLLYAGPLAEPDLAREHLEAFLDLAPEHAQAAQARRILERLPATGLVD